MTITEKLSLIRDFHKKLGYPIATEPIVPSDGKAYFYSMLVVEEALELIAALGFEVRITQALGTNIVEATKTGAPDLVKIVDSLRDLEYVMGSLEVVLGLQDAADDTFIAVHEANMEKQPAGSLGGDMKPTKPPGWQPPDIRGILKQLFPTKALLFR